MFKDTSTYDKDAEDVFGQIICNINCCAIVTVDFVVGVGINFTNLNVWNTTLNLDSNMGMGTDDLHILVSCSAVVCALIACFDLCMILVLLYSCGDWCKKTHSMLTQTFEQGHQTPTTSHGTF